MIYPNAMPTIMEGEMRGGKEKATLTVRVYFCFRILAMARSIKGYSITYEYEVAKLTGCLE